MKRKYDRMTAYNADIVFLPALTPMEAAVLPARERTIARRGALRLAREAFDWDSAPRGGCACGRSQRQKIWVR